MWQRLGEYEYEVDETGMAYTGWYRCVGGQRSDGHWPEWNSRTGESR